MKFVTVPKRAAERNHAPKNGPVLEAAAPRADPVAFVLFCFILVHETISEKQIKSRIQKFICHRS